MSRTPRPSIVMTSLLLILAGAPSPGCGDDSAGGPAAGPAVGGGSGKLRVGYSTRTPLHAAVGEVFTRTDILTRHGFEAEFVPFVRGKDQHEACASGAVDATFSCEVPAMIHLDRLPQMRLVGCAGELGNIALVVRSDSPVEGVIDLSSRSVAVLGGSSAEMALDSWLKDAGLRRDLEVRTESHGGQGETAVEALTRGTVDAAVLWDPWLTAATLEHDLRVVEFVPFWSVVALFDGRDVVADPGPYLDAVSDALAYIGEHPDEVSDWVATTVGISPAAVKIVLEKNTRLHARPTPDTALTEEVLARLRACDRHARMTGDVPPSFRLEDRLGMRP